jgi:uncharacterized protein involved in outer membrane biogenesis
MISVQTQPAKQVGFFKNILIAFGILIVLIILGFAVLFFIFVNPTHLKAQFVEQIYRRTGLQAQVNGPVSWVLTPQLGVRFADVSVKQPVINVARMDVFIAWRPLITGQVQIQKLVAHQFSLQSRQADISGDLRIQIAAQRLQMKPLTIVKGHLRATGQASAQNLFEDPQFTGQLTIEPFRWGRLAFHHPKTHFHFSKTQGLTGDIADDRVIMGHFNIDAMTAQYALDLHQNQVKFTQIKGKAASGVLTAEATVMKALTSPNYQIAATLTQAQLSQLLPSNILQGLADVKMDITMDSAVNGTVQLTANNGVLNRIDLLKQIREVKQFLKTNPQVAEAVKSTPFSRLTASGVINNSLLTNPDFLLESPDIQAAGKGTLNLSDEQIQYRLSVKAQGKMLGNTVGLTVPLIISGTLTSPKVIIDLSAAELSISKSLHHPLKILFGHHKHKSDIMPPNEDNRISTPQD